MVNQYGQVVINPGQVGVGRTPRTTFYPTRLCRKPFVLHGAGMEQTIITDMTGNAWNEPALWIEGLDSHSVRVTDFCFRYGLNGNLQDYNGAIVFRGASQAINLVAGRNWISFSVLPADQSLNSVSNGILGLVEQVKSQNKSAIFSSGQWLGDLLQMESGKGYCILMKAPASLIYLNSGGG